MSGRLQIHFAQDMPPASVEVVSPTLQTVGRLWLGPGQTRGIDVPSEGSFLRVHLGNGEVVTLQDPGNLDRTIDRASLYSRLRRAVSTTVDDMIGLESPGSPAPEKKRSSPTLQGGVAVSLGKEKGSVLDAEREVRFRPPHTEKVYDLSIFTPSDKLSVRLPGSTEEVRVRSELRDERRVVTVRVKTTEAIADTIGGYLCRGDLFSASAMAEWAPDSETLLMKKMRNPFGAMIGAYLLLRLRQFNLMHDWPRNLANRWPKLADGSLIWAWQLIYQQKRDQESEVREYLRRAAEAELPVFTEGMRLLRDSLPLVYKGASADEVLGKKAGVVLWTSPFTASLRRSSGDSAESIEFDVGYASGV